MKKRWLVGLVGMFAVVFSSTGESDHADGASEDNSGCEIINITSKTGVERDAAYFKGVRDNAVIFVPGAVFDKESWFFLARRLQKLDVASLSLDGKTPSDVLSAIDFLKGRGFKHIILVGGSMGGTAVLDVLEGRPDQKISKVILLAPAGGTPIKSERIDKLFIVSKNDRLGLYDTVKTLCDRSAGPKEFVVLDGAEHAQHIFKSGQREALTKLIIDFVVEGEVKGS